MQRSKPPSGHLELMLDVKPLPLFPSQAQIFGSTVSSTCDFARVITRQQMAEDMHHLPFSHVH